MIDPHVHFRDGEQSAKETLLHAMEVASLCGFTGFFDMPNTSPPLTSEKAILERLTKGERVAQGGLFYGVYGGITTDSDQVRELVRLHKNLFPRMVGLKMYAGHSTGNMGIVGRDAQRKVYETLSSANYRGVLALHCEKEELLKEGLLHPLARPPEAETESVRDQLELAQESGFAGTLHICHISTIASLELVKKAKGEGRKVSCGVTPHHVLLNLEAFNAADNLLKMNPPLRGEAERSALFEALLEGSIDWVESDHAPHTLQDKDGGAAGIPGFGGMLLLLKRLSEAGVSLSQLERLYGGRVAEVFEIEIHVKVPTLEQIETALEVARRSYPWDPYVTLH
ncbi:MAG: dihydroorotase [Spirochaetales bacterium]|nr:dihydroorotase [Spirochaetales bacterium]